jgi:uncharacterized repeat protein (TIGR03803 family)
MKNFRVAMMIPCILLTFCAVTAIHSPAQTLTTIHNFCSQSNCNDGVYPLGLLIQTGGNFYGTTYAGGSGDPYAMGVVYKLTPSGGLTVLANFDGLDGGGQPYAGVAQGHDGNLYGVTTIGGNTPSGCGAAVKVSPSGGMTVLHAFNGAPNDACQVWGPLLQASDGNFYGASNAGGNGGCGGGGCGTVFKMTPSGAVSVLYNFADHADGGGPLSGLLQASDGKLYGETTMGGAYNYGTIFKISLSGAFTALHSFNDSDGYLPDGGLIQASDGNLYGITNGGGAGTYGPYGTVFKITPSGTLTTLYNFCSQSGCTDGRGPYGGLVQGKDGNFYGTTLEGGTSNYGTAFAITPSGSLSTIYNFCSKTSCADGAYPYAGLTLGSDGNFYGVTKEGGNSSNSGTAFKLQVTEDTLTVSISGSGTVTSTDGHINCPGTCSHLYSHNAPLTLNQTPAGGWTFAAWSGACTGTGSCNLTMSQNQSVGATFTQNTYQLSVTTSGSGTVTSADGFINCPATCSHIYLSNTQVTLNATPALGWSFTDWGGACSGTGSCKLTMTQNLSASATFTQNYYTLTASVAGSGTVTNTDGQINCPGTCSHTYISLTQVKLNATPASGWSFSGWTGACMGVGSCTVTMTQNLAVTGVFMQTGAGLQLTPVTPCRVVDTRQSTSTFGGPSIQGGDSRSFPLPQGACSIPSSAAAYSLNVTVVPHKTLGYLTIWPTGEAQPGVSLMNSPDGRVNANAAIVPAGSQGAVSVFVTDTSDVILDINGYFGTPGSQTYQFYPLTPCRIIDTRSGNGGPLLKGEARDYTMAGQCGIPATATAYSFNITVLPTNKELDYLTVWPQGQAMPVVSTLNDGTGTVVANAAIVPAGDNNATAFYAHDNPTNLLVDVNGYFAAPGAGSYSLYPTAPCRVLDTRNNGGKPFTGPKVVPVESSACALPSSAQAYVFNATVVPPGSMPYLTMWPDGSGQPVVSTLNAYDGFITSNMAIVPSTNGSIDAYAAGLTQLILDISGYFAP